MFSTSDEKLCGARTEYMYTVIFTTLYPPRIMHTVRTKLLI